MYAAPSGHIAGTRRLAYSRASSPGFNLGPHRSSDRCHPHPRHYRRRASSEAATLLRSLHRDLQPSHQPGRLDLVRARAQQESLSQQEVSTGLSDFKSADAVASGARNRGDTFIATCPQQECDWDYQKPYQFHARTHDSIL